jgi:hypothetical protein
MVECSLTWAPQELAPKDPQPGIGQFVDRLRLERSLSGVVSLGADVPMKVSLDLDGFVRLWWAPGVKITGELAHEAVAAVNRICAGGRRPMLVDMTATGELTRDARVVFAQRSSASAIALLGRSAVDRVIANFALGVSPVPVATRFFTSESVALAWLRDVGSEREP